MRLSKKYLITCDILKCGFQSVDFLMACPLFLALFLCLEDLAFHLIEKLKGELWKVGISVPACKPLPLPISFLDQAPDEGNQRPSSSLGFSREERSVEPHAPRAGVRGEHPVMRGEDDSARPG